MARVSILIPCYNNGSWVADTIHSALAQSHPDKEVIVLDDGSSDNSLEVIKSFGDRIRWETGPNRGGNIARNRLMEMATGEYLQFLDADDALLPDKVANQLEAMDDDTDLVYGSVTIQWWEDGTMKSESVSLPNPHHDLYAHWMNWQLVQTGAALWRASSLEAIGGWNEAYPCCQDNEICLRAIEKSLTFKRSTDAGAVYRIWSSNSVSRKNPARLVQVKTELVDRMIQWLKDNGKLTPLHLDIASRAAFLMARSMASYDLEAACNFAQQQKNKGLIVCPRAEVSVPFWIAYSLFGFRFAEKVASTKRKLTGSE